MLKALGMFVVGFVGTILVLNAVTWLFGQAVAAVVAWFIVFASLIALVIGMTVGGYEAKPLNEKQVAALKAYWQKENA